MVIVGIIALLLGLSLNGLDYLIQWNKLNTAAALLSSELKNTQSITILANFR
jgi:Tfp pilus assembly protein FimT